MISSVLRKIFGFGPKRNEVTWEWRRLHNEELYDFCSSPNTIRVIKSRRIKRAGHVAWIWVHTRFWCGSLREGDHLENLGVDGKQY